MAITRNQTRFGKEMPSFDQGKPGYDRNVNSLETDDLHPSTIQYAEVAVTAVEMLALRATPKSLVAAPDAGYALEFVSALFIYDYTDAYTETDDNIAIRYENGSGTVVSLTLETTGFLDATSDKMSTISPLATDVLVVANKALVLHNTGNGEWGGTGSACRVKVAYRVHATGL